MRCRTSLFIERIIMARRAYKALGTFTTQHGPIIVRKVYSEKQGSFILVLEGPHASVVSRKLKA